MLEYILIAVVSFVLGWKLSEFFTAIAMKKILEDLNVTDGDLKKLLPDQGAAGTEITLRIESVDGELLAFEKSNNNFVAQGHDPDLLLARIIDRFPAGTRITIDTDNDGAVMLPAVGRLKRS